MVDEGERGASKRENSVKYPGDLNAEEYFLAKRVGAKLDKIEDNFDLTSKQKKLLDKHA